MRSTRVTLNDVPSPGDDLGAAPVTHREPVVGATIVVLRKSANTLGRGLPERVDRLLVVADPEYRGPFVGDEAKNAQVARVQVLVLVHDQHVEIETL
jgi:hypothetical protein